MTDDITRLEQRLIEGYREQLGHYERALRCAEEPAEAKDLLAALDAVARSDAAIGDAKTAWRSCGRSPGPELREVLDRVGERIRTLSECIDRRIARTQAQKQDLIPEMDALIQRRRMLHAYRRF